MRSAPVRLAELVAALSLGIDLGFGQPMEHVLRQCVIALRLGEQAGLSEDDRATIYYVALLVNVGCHSDAYEQAKWFGDDIGLRSTKYLHEPMSFGDIVETLRRVGSGGPPLHRLRTGLEVAISGRREVSEMLTGHAVAGKNARRGARTRRRRARRARGVIRAVGRSWVAGRVEGDDIPIAARVVHRI